MDRTEFIIAMAVVLFGTFVLGWVGATLLHRFTRVSSADMEQLDEMATALHEAEETRDQAIAYLQQREAELFSQLGQTEAELSAAMDGLREARREAEELRAYIERSSEG